MKIKLKKTIEITDKECFSEWLSNCPVDYEFYDRVEDDDIWCEFYYFRIPIDKTEDSTDK